tara:strand:- start:3330 stop:3899 length:570 start_codon:yes stop_codon:yes gene_type:complete
MSDNKILKENTVRRFMKLANMPGLTDSFINEKYKAEDIDEVNVDASEAEGDDTLEEQEMDMGEEEPEMEMGMDDEEPDMEMDMGDEEDDAMGAADISLTEEEAQLLIDLGERLKEAMGAEGGMDIGDEDPIEEPEDNMGDMDAEEEEEEEEPVGMAYGGDAAAMQEELVQEVLKRVTKRIVANKIKNRK